MRAAAAHRHDFDLRHRTLTVEVDGNLRTRQASERGGGVKRHDATRPRMTTASTSSAAIDASSGRAAMPPAASNCGTSA